jgi:hypothetical protein
MALAEMFFQALPSQQLQGNASIFFFSFTFYFFPDLLGNFFLLFPHTCPSKLWR